MIQEATIDLAQARKLIKRASLRLLETVNSEKEKVETLATKIQYL